MTVTTPAWSEFSKSFQYDHFGDSGFKMNERADGHYGYFTMFQNADEITITLYKTSGENAGLYWKTFSSGKLHNLVGGAPAQKVLDTELQGFRLAK